MLNQVARKNFTLTPTSASLALQKAFAAHHFKRLFKTSQGAFPDHFLKQRVECTVWGVWQKRERNGYARNARQVILSFAVAVIVQMQRFQQFGFSWESAFGCVGVLVQDEAEVNVPVLSGV